MAGGCLVSVRQGEWGRARTGTSEEVGAWRFRHFEGLGLSMATTVKRRRLGDSSGSEKREKQMESPRFPMRVCLLSSHSHGGCAPTVNVFGKTCNMEKRWDGSNAKHSQPATNPRVPVKQISSTVQLRITAPQGSDTGLVLADRYQVARHWCVRPLAQVPGQRRYS